MGGTRVALHFPALASPAGFGPRPPSQRPMEPQLRSDWLICALPSPWQPPPAQRPELSREGILAAWCSAPTLRPGSTGEGCKLCVRSPPGLGPRSCPHPSPSALPRARHQDTDQRSIVTIPESDREGAGHQSSHCWRMAREVTFWIQATSLVQGSAPAYWSLYTGTNLPHPDPCPAFSASLSLVGDTFPLNICLHPHLPTISQYFLMWPCSCQLV